MKKNFFTYSVFLVLFLSFIGSIGFLSILKYHYDGGTKYQFLQKSVVFFASIPMNVKKMIKYKTYNLDKVEELVKHKKKERFKRFINTERNALLILPRYDLSLNRSVVDIVNLDNFKVIHTYKHNIQKMNNQIKNIKEFPRIKIDYSPLRFRYKHPLLFEDGSLISMYGPVYKIDLCSNLLWINDQEKFHHSQMLDYEGNIWIGGEMNPKSKYIKKFHIKDYADDSIIKINTDGEILFNKSITEILIENNILADNFALNSSLSNLKSPIHLNDIEPALSNTKYWKQGDVFINLRNQNSIIHYRPSNNEVINYITGPFAQQHDVDIISDKEISIFNNNNFYVNSSRSEILVYNFETKNFSKLFNAQLQNENFKTNTGGLSHTLKDGSLIVDESNHGRIILFNNKGKKEWEFVNKDKNGNIGSIIWSRIIEDESFIEKYKSLLKNKKCLN